MLTLTAPANLNGAKLREELTAVGVTVNREDIVLNGTLLHFLTLPEGQEEAVTTVVAAHVGGPSTTEAATATRLADANTAIDAMLATPGLRTKAKAVAAGTDTFTAAQLQRATATCLLAILIDRG